MCEEEIWVLGPLSSEVESKDLVELFLKAVRLLLAGLMHLVKEFSARESQRFEIPDLFYKVHLVAFALMDWLRELVLDLLVVLVDLLSVMAPQENLKALLV